MCAAPLALLVAAGSGCCEDDGDGEDDPPQVRIDNNTSYYLHIFHPSEVFLYVRPGSSVWADSGGGQVVVATAAGQSLKAKASGPTPGCCSTSCGSVNISSGSDALSVSATAPNCGGGGGSCPYIYVRRADGRFALQGEVLTGALYAGAARWDAIVLPDAARDQRGRYTVRIAAERPERELIDAAWLELLEHPRGTRVVVDRRGEPLALAGLRPPVRAVDARGVDRRAEVRRADARRWIGALPGAGGTHDHLRLRFPQAAGRAAGARPMVLVLRARNTAFIEHAYHAFLRELGPGLPKLMRLLDGLPWYSATLDWLARSGGLTLAVQRRVGRRWVTAAHVSPLGSAAGREVALRLPSTAEIRLRALAGAWEVDQVLATARRPRTVRGWTVHPVGAREEPHSRSVTSVTTASASDAASRAPARPVSLEVLRSRADERVVALDPGRRLSLTFDAPAGRAGGRGRAITAVLRIRGHYEPLDSSSKPCLALGRVARCFLPGEANFAAYARQQLELRRRGQRELERLLTLDRAGRLRDPRREPHRSRR